MAKSTFLGLLLGCLFCDGLQLEDGVLKGWASSQSSSYQTRWPRDHNEKAES